MDVQLYSDYSLNEITKLLTSVTRLLSIMVKIVYAVACDDSHVLQICLNY